MPTLPSGQQLLAQQGKQGTIYLLNINNLGKYCINSTPGLLAIAIRKSCRRSWVRAPAFGDRLRTGTAICTGPGANDSIKAYSFNANNSGLISTSPTSTSAQIFAWSAPTPAISANGNTNGILWALDGSADDSTCDGGSSNCLGLYAYDATNLANLYMSAARPRTIATRRAPR